MKKILFLLSVLSLFINIVKAEENTWQEELLDGENVEVEYRYRFYTETTIGNYLKKGQAVAYQYEDINKVMYSSYSNYKTICEENPNEYLIIKEKKYEYQEILPIQYVKIINPNSEKLKIKNISIYNMQTKLTHKVYSFSNATEDGMSIEEDGYVIFWMPMSVSVRKFSLALELENDNLDYELVFSNSNSFASNKLVAKTTGNSSKTLYKYDDVFTLYDNYGGTYIAYNIIIDDLVKVLSVQDVCRTRLILTYHYNIKKEYYDDNYYASIDDLELEEEEKKLYQKDSNDYKIFYRYKQISEENMSETKDVIVNNQEDDDRNNTFSNTENTISINNSKNNIVSEEALIDNIESNIKLVKTGVEKENLNYNYLIIYVLILVLITLILIKHLKNNVE